MPKKLQKTNEQNNLDRITAIRTIFDVFEKNKETFKQRMQTECEKDPAYFYRKYVEPLQPKEIEFDLKNAKTIVGFKFTEVDKNNLQRDKINED